MNLVLIGYRCCGKTSVGRALARVLKRRFVDTDDLIEEQAGRAIQEMVLEEGWETFRARETETLTGLAGGGNLVIATGGGVVTRPENVRILRRSGVLLWLRAGPGVIRERMAKEERDGRVRPPLAGKDVLEEIEEILAARDPLYAEAADARIETDGLSIEEGAARALEVFLKTRRR